MNSTDGRIKANAAIVAAGSSGGVSVFVTDATHVILDVGGYFVDAGANPAALAFYALPPCRISDTRRPAGPLGGPSLAPFQPRDIAVRSSACGAPSNATAYSLNFTSVSALPLGWITAWATGTATPLASTLNAPTGTVTANAAIIPAGTNGSVSVYASDMTDLIVDINGYFAPPGAGGLSFYNLSPCRVADTRNASAPLGGPELTGTRQLPISTSACGVPANAGALSLNATVMPGPFLGYLTLWPAASAMPVVSTLNAWDAAITSNAAIVPASTGSISAFASDPAHLILDISGYFAP